MRRRVARRGTWRLARTIALTLMMGTAGLVCGDADAQPFTAGATFGTGCRGSEASVCGNGGGVMSSVTGGVWLTERLLVDGRLAFLTMNDFRGDTRSQDGSTPLRIAYDRKPRRYAALEALYHFGPQTIARAFVGGAVGRYVDRTIARCVDPPGCDALVPPYFPLGPRSESQVTGTFLVGIAGPTLRGRLDLRGGAALHNFGAEHQSTVELFFGASYRFGRRDRQKIFNR